MELSDEYWSVWLPQELTEQIKEVMKKKGYGNKKSEFIRYALRKAVEDNTPPHKKEDG